MDPAPSPTGGQKPELRLIPGKKKQPQRRLPKGAGIRLELDPKAEIYGVLGSGAEHSPHRWI